MAARGRCAGNRAAQSRLRGLSLGFLPAWMRRACRRNSSRAIKSLSRGGREGLRAEAQRELIESIFKTQTRRRCHHPPLLANRKQQTPVFPGDLSLTGSNSPALRRSWTMRARRHGPRGELFCLIEVEGRGIETTEVRKKKKKKQREVS